MSASLSEYLLVSFIMMFSVVFLSSGRGSAIFSFSVGGESRE